ncbi:MAG: hypothetical protein WCA46_16035 [Actinocatenispora sp.]
MTETANAGGISIDEVRHGGPRVDRVYTDVLRPSFPPAELVSLASLRAGVTAGRVTLMIASDTQGVPHGVAVGEWSESARVMRLNYLAAAPGERSRGIGGRLLSAAVESWRGRYRPFVLLAQVERPDQHRASAQHGDPTARLRFYQRYGARALNLPHYQPALSPGGDRSYGLLLIALHADDEFRVGPEELTAAPIRRFLVDFLAAGDPDPDTGDGTDPDGDGRVDQDDPAALALLSAAERADGIRMVDLDDYRRIPASAGQVSG